MLVQYTTSTEIYNKGAQGPGLRLFFGNITLMGGKEFILSKKNVLICFIVIVNEKSTQISPPIHKHSTNI